MLFMYPLIKMKSAPFQVRLFGVQCLLLLRRVLLALRKAQSICYTSNGCPLERLIGPFLRTILIFLCLCLASHSGWWLVDWLCSLFRSIGAQFFSCWAPHWQPFLPLWLTMRLQGLSSNESFSIDTIRRLNINTALMALTKMWMGSSE